MADVSKLEINENTYDLKDSAARASITDLQSEMSDKEDVSNKVTSMSAASTDAEYPSAKCVYDALENSQLFFKCIFRQTLYQDIANAITAGKIPYLIHDSILMFLCTYNIPASGTNRYVDFGFGFNADDGNLLGRIRVTYQETWSFLRFVKTQTIDSASTNSQLPTAKSVYDFVTGYAVKLYRHNITITYATEPSDAIYVSILSISNVAMDAEAFMTYAASQFDKLYGIQASGTFHDTASVSGTPDRITVDSYPSAQGGTLVISGRTSSGTALSRVMYRTVDNFVITDTVVEVQ